MNLCTLHLVSISSRAHMPTFSARPSFGAGSSWRSGRRSALAALHHPRQERCEYSFAGCNPNRTGAPHFQAATYILGAGAGFTPFALGSALGLDLRCCPVSGQQSRSPAFWRAYLRVCLLPFFLEHKAFLRHRKLPLLQANHPFICSTKQQLLSFTQSIYLTNRRTRWRLYIRLCHPPLLAELPSHEQQTT